MENYLKLKEELIKLEKEDEKNFKKLVKAKGIKCDKFDLICKMVPSKIECLQCDYFLNTIKPIEDESLKLLVKITDLQKKINELENEEAKN